jgi:hypothetical protein
MKLLNSPPQANRENTTQILRVFLANRKLQIAASVLDAASGEREIAYIIADVMRHIEAAAKADNQSKLATEIFASFEARIKILLKREAA